jgi:hypothetical protein
VARGLIFKSLVKKVPKTIFEFDGFHQTSRGERQVYIPRENAGHSHIFPHLSIKGTLSLPLVHTNLSKLWAFSVTIIKKYNPTLTEKEHLVRSS